MKIFNRFMVVVLGVAVLSACGPTKPEKKKPAVEDRSTQSGAAGKGKGSTSTGLKGPGGIDIGSLDDPGTPLGKKVVYFDYNQSDIKAEYKIIITAHARYLSANPKASIILQGHTDERGSREYNVGLGERRARAVRRMLLLLGVTDSQIKTISYGEERPAQDGHDEAAWSKNRRVVIVYTNK